MFYSKLDKNKYLIRLVLGEEINGSIRKFCEKLKIENAEISAIGSVDSPTLAHYRVDTKKYKEKTFEGIFEITSLVGSVAISEGKPLVHAHVTISDEEMKAFGGHLVKGVASATVEIILTAFDSKHTKSFDKKIGLKIWDLEKGI
jgi:uncharacterized protein